MKGILVLPALLLFAAALADCSSPSTSGSKTNWFHSCDDHDDCGEENSCLCGVCTVSCLEDADCEEGFCSFELETSVQCGARPEQQRICLPSSDAPCFEAPLIVDDELGEAVPPDCDIAGALICQSFDRLLPDDHSTWLDGEMNASIQDCELSQGAGALRYQSSGVGQAQTRMVLPSSVSTGPLHARFFLRLSGATDLPDQLQLLELWEDEGDDISERASLFVGSDGVPRTFIGASNTTVQPDDAVPLPRDAWICLEWAINVQDQTGSVELSVDGQSVLSRSGFDTQPDEPISVVVVEGQLTGDTEGVDLFVDELVVGTQPIGCQ
ncbi:MAG TPA: hypothetical protein VN764_12205 [Polyangiaceae bacterium]|nr:hypothetical protein [Polyangiaceae bacterium]